MTEVTKQTPTLFTIDSSATAIYRRFQGWPDTYLTEQTLAELVSNPDQLPVQTRELLVAKGALRTVDGQWLVCLPVFEQLPTSVWSDALAEAGKPYLETLSYAVEQLKGHWQARPGMPTWPEVAHSLLLGFLLWGCGGRLLLAQQQVEVTALIVTDPGTTAALWHGFVRANQDYGVSTMLGNDFKESERVHRLLKRVEVGQALYTLAEDKSLLVLHPQASRTLLRLGGLTTEKPDDNGLHYAAWPVLSPAQLALMKSDLFTVVAGLNLFLEETVVKVLPAITPAYPELLPADLAMLLFAILTKQLADAWQQVGLLPELVRPQLGDLK